MIQKEKAMHIGILKYKELFTFSHINSNILFPPSSKENGAFCWSWQELFDTGVDVSFELEKDSYIGAVCFSVPKKSLAGVTVLVDGKAAGLRESPMGELFGEEVCIAVGVRGKSITLRLFSDFQDIKLRDITVLGAYDYNEPFLWPSPRTIEFTGNTVRIAKIESATDDPDEIFAKEFLYEGLREKLGAFESEEGVTVLIEKAELDGERYTVAQSENTITLSGAKRISLLYATNAFISLTDNSGFHVAEIDDSPSAKLRGFHFGLPHRDKIEFTRRLLRYVLLPMRYNVIFLEFAGGMRFDRHPEISEGWLLAAENAKAKKQPFMPHSDKVSRWSLLEKEEVRQLVSYAKELGFALIPEVQSLAHVQYITYAHPEIAELDEKTVEVDVREGADARPEAFYAHSYCPSNPKSYEIIYDIIDEIIEITEPSGYVHIGHDEVYQIGLCERCRQKDPSDLFCDHVTALHAYLAKKGLKTMMWSDMLHPAPVTDYPTWRAACKLPRDIVMLDFIWYFHPDKDIEDDLLPLGYKVAVGNLYSSHYTRFNSRIKKRGMIGGEISSWLITDEDILARNGKLWDLMYLSEMLWNTDGYDERNRRTYNEIISKHVQPEVRDRVREKFVPEGYGETSFKTSGNAASIPRELTELLPHARWADGIDIDIGECQKYDRLIFEHTTLNSAPRIVWKENTYVGSYIIEYEDGTSAEARVCYGDGVTCYKDGYAIPKHQQYYRHFGYVGTWFADPVYEGKNERGDDVTVLGYVWENPYPEKRITRITYKKAKDDYCCLIVAGVKGLRANKE